MIPLGKFEKRFIIDEDGNLLDTLILHKNEDIGIVRKSKNLTPQQINVSEQKKMVKEYNKRMGGFIMCCFVSNELLFNSLNLDLPSISRIIYLSTYLSYNSKEEGLLVIHQEGKKDIPMTRKMMQKKLKLKDATFENFLSDVRKSELLFSVGDKYYINPQYISKGECKFNNKEYTRIYIDKVRYLYEYSKVSQHKQLSYVFQLIPYLHYQLNVVCHNPNETDKMKIKRMTLTEICDLLNVSVSYKSTLKKNLLRFHVDIYGYKYYLFSYVTVEVLDGKKDFFAVNPSVLWRGDNVDEINEVIKGLVFNIL